MEGRQVALYALNGTTKLQTAQAAEGETTTEGAADGEEAKEGTVYDADYKVEDEGNDSEDK